MKIEWTTQEKEESLQWNTIQAGSVFGIVFDNSDHITPYIKTKNDSAVGLSDGAVYDPNIPGQPSRFVLLDVVLSIKKSYRTSGLVLKETEVD